MSPTKLRTLAHSARQKLYKVRSRGDDTLSRKEDKVFSTSTPVSTPNYLDRESMLGAQIFGTIPEGVDRKFFHSTSKNVWIWHENGTTIRYEVRPHGVFKRVNAGVFERLSSTELKNFRTATRQYLTTIKTQLYSFPHPTHEN